MSSSWPARMSHTARSAAHGRAPEEGPGVADQGGRARPHRRGVDRLGDLGSMCADPRRGPHRPSRRRDVLPGTGYPPAGRLRSDDRPRRRGCPPASSVAPLCTSRASSVGRNRWRRGRSPPKRDWRWVAAWRAPACGLPRGPPRNRRCPTTVSVCPSCLLVLPRSWSRSGWRWRWCGCAPGVRSCGSARMRSSPSSPAPPRGPRAARGPAGLGSATRTPCCWRAAPVTTPGRSAAVDAPVERRAPPEPEVASACGALLPCAGNQGDRDGGKPDIDLASLEPRSTSGPVRRRPGWVPAAVVDPRGDRARRCGGRPSRGGSSGPRAYTADGTSVVQSGAGAGGSRRRERRGGPRHHRCHYIPLRTSRSCRLPWACSVCQVPAASGHISMTAETGDGRHGPRCTPPTRRARPCAGRRWWQGSSPSAWASPVDPFASRVFPTSATTGGSLGRAIVPIGALLGLMIGLIIVVAVERADPRLGRRPVRVGGGRVPDLRRRLARRGRASWLRSSCSIRPQGSG